MNAQAYSKEQDEVIINNNNNNQSQNLFIMYLLLFQKLLQPFVYIQQVPGKQIRAKLALAFNYWMKIPNDKLSAVGDIVQMLHNSSLL